MSFGSQEVREASLMLQKQQGIIKTIFYSLVTSMLLNVILVVAIIFMFPLKEKKPYLMFFSNAEQNFVRVMPIGGKITGEEALLKTLVASYVTKRETINRIDDSDRYKDIELQSTPMVWDNFVRIIKEKNSIYRQDTITRKIKINNISFVVNNANAQIAQVDFIAELFKEGKKEKVEAYRATIDFTLAKNEKSNQAKNLERNPVGFFVKAYSISEIKTDFVNTKENVEKESELE